jgi:hypothetical protein
MADRPRADDQPGLLQEFPFHRFLKGLAQFDAAAGHGPLPHGRGLIPADQKHLFSKIGVVSEHHAAYGDTGAVRVFGGHQEVRLFTG